VPVVVFTEFLPKNITKTGKKDWLMYEMCAIHVAARSRILATKQSLSLAGDCFTRLKCAEFAMTCTLSIDEPKDFPQAMTLVLPKSKNLRAIRGLSGSIDFVLK
jgi:hypothetical protein